MTKLSRTRTASLIAAGALAGAALLAPATAAASGPTVAPLTAQGGCGPSLFSWDVATGRNDYAMLTVHVQARSALPEGCSVSFSLNAYTAQGPTWPTSGTQALLDHQSVTLSAGSPSGQLTVAQPPCFGQTDLYAGTARFDGQDGALPHYPNSVTPTGLIAYSNGGAPCDQPSQKPSSSPSDSPSPSASDPVQSESPSPSDSPSPSASDPVQSESPSASPSDQPSTSPSDQPSTSPSDSPSASPSDSPSASPSTSPSDSPSDQPSTQPSSQPSGSVLGETGVPQITPPPTDTTTAQGGSTGTGWQLIVLAIAGLALSLIALTPATARKRR